MHVYSFANASVSTDRPLLGTYVRKGQERITWVQTNAENMLTRRWFEFGNETLFEPQRYVDRLELE